jgi:Raf kinase inhibitor-like YbhB/YbcL family protein
MDSRVVWCLVCCAFQLVGVVSFAADNASISVLSPDFAQGAGMSAKFAEKGGNTSPALQIGGVPATAKSLVLIVDDPDSPAGLWTHWLVWNLPVTTTALAEGKLPPGAIQGKNSFGRARYDGPIPPSGTHRYFFHVYALDAPLLLPEGTGRAALESAMKGHIVGTGETFGTYSASQ